MQKPELLGYNIIAKPEDLKPSSPETKIIGVFNPGVTTIIEDGLEKTLLMVRVAEAAKEEPKNMTLLPHFPVTNDVNSPFEIKFDQEEISSLLDHGPKNVRLRNTLARLKHISYPIRAVSRNGVEIDWKEEKPTFYPCYEHERFGQEDFRIAKIIHPYDGAIYAMTYVCPHREHMVSTSVAITRDFSKFERLPYGDEPKPIFRGVKDIVLFPEMVPSPSKKDPFGNRKLVNAALTRHSSFTDFSNPTIWITYAAPDSLSEWDSGYRIRISEDDEMSGTGAALIGLEDMWFGVYHLVKRDGSNNSNRYYGALFGLKKDEPHKLLYRSPVLMTPGEHGMGSGFIPGVVYPSGLAVRDGIAYIYSGEDDTWTSVRKYYIEDLVKFLKKENINGH